MAMRPADNAKLEAAAAEHPGCQVELSLGPYGFRYLVDLSSMRQTNMRTGAWRTLRREAPGAHSYDDSDPKLKQVHGLPFRVVPPAEFIGNGSAGSWIAPGHAVMQQDQSRLNSSTGSPSRASWTGSPSRMLAGNRSVGEESARSASSRSREALSPRSSNPGRARRHYEMSPRDRSCDSDTPGPQSYEMDKIRAAWQRLSTSKLPGPSHRMPRALRTPVLQHNGLISRDFSDSVDTPGPGYYDTSRYKRALTPRGACRFPQSLRLSPHWVGAGAALERESSARRKGRLSNREQEYGLRSQSTSVDKQGLPGPLVTPSPPPPPKAMYRRTKGAESATAFPNATPISEKVSDDVGTQFVRSLRAGLYTASGSARPARGNSPRGARQRPQSAPPEKSWRTPPAHA